jgi:hypothetical protein
MSGEQRFTAKRDVVIAGRAYAAGEMVHADAEAVRLAAARGLVEQASEPKPKARAKPTSRAKPKEPSE